MRSRHKPSRRPADCSFCPCTARILNEVDTYFGYWCGAEDYITHFIKGAYDLNDDVAATATVIVFAAAALAAVAVLRLDLAVAVLRHG